MTSTDDQLELLQDDLSPKRWVCPTCRGNLNHLQLLYPDEREPGGPLVAVKPCRTCFASGWLDYDPDDRSEIPF